MALPNIKQNRFFAVVKIEKVNYRLAVAALNDMKCVQLLFASGAKEIGIGEYFSPTRLKNQVTFRIAATGKTYMSCRKIFDTNLFLISDGNIVAETLYVYAKINPSGIKNYCQLFIFALQN